MLSSEDNVLFKNLLKCKRFSATRLIKRFPQQEWEKTNIETLSVKVANNRFDRMHSRKQSAVCNKCDVLCCFKSYEVVWRDSNGEVVNFVAPL